MSEMYNELHIVHYFEILLSQWIENITGKSQYNLYIKS